MVYGTLNVKSSLSSLSLRRSFKELTMERHSQLDVLDVFRVVAIIWVIVNHTGSEGRVDILDRLPSAEKFKVSRFGFFCDSASGATTQARQSITGELISKNYTADQRNFCIAIAEKLESVEFMQFARNINDRSSLISHCH